MKRIKLTRIIGQTNQMASTLQNVHFAGFSHRTGWQPAVNAYRLEDRFEVCVDLAGIDRDSIDLRADSNALTISGTRTPPEPNAPALDVLALEIESGPFKRTLSLPGPINTQRTTARHKDGLLWITLPFQQPA